MFLWIFGVVKIIGFIGDKLDLECEDGVCLFDFFSL